MRMLRLALLFIAMPAAVRAQTPARATLAVMPFSAATVVPGEDASAMSSTLAGMIATELSNRPTVQLVERQKVDDLITSRQLALSGRLTDDAAVQVGELLGAQYVVTGGVTFDRNSARLDLRLIDVETGAVPRAFKDRVSRDNFLDMVERLAAEFTTDLKLNAPVVARAVEVPIGAQLAFSRGLDYERRGIKDKAAAMFARALEIHPDHSGAQTALARVK